MKEKLDLMPYNAAFFFFIGDYRSGEFFHPTVAIRSDTDGSLDEYKYPLAGFKLTSQADMGQGTDGRKMVYAVRFETELNLSNAARIMPAVKRLNKKLAAWKKNNLPPTTFGGNVWMLGRCLGINKVFIRKPHTYNNFNFADRLGNYWLENLKESVYSIDNQISELNPAIKTSHMLEFSEF